VRLCTAAVILAVFLGIAPAAAQTFEPYDTAVLGGMDKVTARVSQFEVKVGETAEFGTLEVTPRTCQKTPPEEAPESAAFLEIDDVRDDAQVRVFSGWMFASSPGVSALEHPVYDVWVLDCVSSVAEEPEASDESEASAGDAVEGDATESNE
jgi:hypothetical protein